MNEEEIDCVNGIFGNPGAGKSTLLNCLITQRQFVSGLSAGGLTKKLQKFCYRRQLWIDTPGLADPTMRTEAAAEIESGLKKGQRYKLAFVVTTDAGRVRVQDIETINCVCDAIKTDFTFGLIINKLTPSAQNFLQKNENIQLSTSLMHKQPSAIVMIPKVAEAEDEDNVLITDPLVYQRLASFFDDLQASFIRESEVDKIDTRNFDEKVQELTLEFERKLAEAEAAKAEEEQRRKAAEAARAEEERRRRAAEAAKAEEEQKRKAAEKEKAEEEQKRKAAEEERVVKSETETKIECGPEGLIGNRTENHSCRKLFKPKKTWHFDIYGKTETTSSRTKMTRKSGAVDYSEWVTISSREVQTREVHTHTT